MSHLCPSCGKTFTQKEVIRTDEMLPGRKYYGWSSCNHYCPHCKVLLEYIKPAQQPYIDCSLFILLVLYAFTVRFGSSILRPPTGFEILLAGSALALIYLRYYLRETKGRYVLA